MSMAGVSGEGGRLHIRRRAGGLNLDDLDACNSRLRALPQVQRLLEHAELAELEPSHGRAAVLAAARDALDAARTAIRGGAEADEAALVDQARRLVLAAEAPRLRPVINATGVILHTNLGRAPLSKAAVEAAAAAGGYSNLEYDLEDGRRGSRLQGVEPLLREITGAEAALAVNNAAAAVLLALSALARDGEVIVSRGELVEIGGGFRIPEVIAQGGARLVEVGTTNKTRLADYAAAVGPETRMLLKVHQSNYRMLGFTGEAGIEALSGLARACGLLLMHDLGSGALVDLTALGAPPEPTVQQSLAAGADLVAFSGDKLMGGPQAGLLVGRAAALEPLRRHPLLRALRLDKMTLAALEASLRAYRDPARAAREIPALAMLAQTPEALAERAARLVAALSPAACEVAASEAFTGGGTLPARPIESRAVAIAAPIPAETLAARLRRGQPPVVGRIADGRLLLDMRTVADAQVEVLAEAVRAALEGAP